MKAIILRWITAQLTTLLADPEFQQRIFEWVLDAISKLNGPPMFGTPEGEDELPRFTVTEAMRAQFVECAKNCPGGECITEPAPDPAAETSGDESTEGGS